VAGDDVRAAAGSAVVPSSPPPTDTDWSVAVPELDFTAASVLAHAAVAMLWCSVDLHDGRADNAAFRVGAETDAPNRRILTSVLVGARALAVGLDAAPPDTRGFHPFGSPDPSGFAAWRATSCSCTATTRAGASSSNSHETNNWRGACSSALRLAPRRRRRGRLDHPAVGERAGGAAGPAVPGALAPVLPAPLRVGRLGSLTAPPP